VRQSPFWTPITPKTGPLFHVQTQYAQQVPTIDAVATVLRIALSQTVEPGVDRFGEVRALLTARSKLVDIRRDIENQMRGLLKSLGIVLGKGGAGVLAARIAAILRQAARLRPLIDPLMAVHDAIAAQAASYDAQIKALTRSDQIVRGLMTVPGVGPVTALAFKSTVDDPGRFKSAGDVGAYLGLTPRRYQSGEMDRTGRISKRGDRLTRSYLYEAANVLLKVVRRGSPLKSWGLKLAKRIGPKKAKIAVARKMAIIKASCKTGAARLIFGSERG